MRDDRLDLLIVGAGPAGLLASMFASQLGLRHRVVEARQELHKEPAAHVLKTHTMEVYRRLGVAEAVLAAATPVDLQRCVTWCESVAGLIYGQLDLTGMKGDVPRFRAVSPAHSANIPQSLLEPILHRRAVELAGAEVVSFGTAFRGFEEDGDGVMATLAGPGGDERVQTRYLIGADGARSAVRRAAGIGFEGPRVLANFLAVHIRSDVTPFLRRAPGVLFFIRRPGFEGFFIMHQPVGSQVLMMRFDPEQTPFESFDRDCCANIVREAIGAPHDFVISSVDQWAMSAQVATEYRRGRVILVGDAAHRFPPTGGLGLNTGVEDVENLLWKLGAVIRGEAGSALLDSYARETRPVAVRNCDQSVSNHRRMQEVDDAIGLGGTAVEARLAAMRADPSHPAFAAIRAAVDAQLPHFAFLELEMAATAAEGAFLPPGRPIARPVPASEGYQPSFAPGGPVPHLWIAPGVSTVDLMRPDRFTLLAPEGSEAEWAAACATLSPRTMPVQVRRLSTAMRGGSACTADFWGGPAYAVLVRPDGRIAWVEPEGGADRRAALHEAMRNILGHVAALAGTAD
ncbi:FAD-dependent monooxygenase [Muricoccus aerilatus]|uniref:FAD-dependent monooxygenase n=1 Tax=Muricoccus aerilatus TaxID=452982 RepID=UPI0005C1C7F9|nr:FAD-dependent monooxygenase [Roseomonas aerilata]